MHYEINSEIEWQPLSGTDNAAYYGCYAAMIGLPVFYVVGGVGAATVIYYRRKLRTPIAQLQTGIENIEIKREPQDTAALLNEVKSNIRQLARDKKIVFKGNILTPTISIDKSVFFRITENLVQNALRYAEKQVNVSFSRKGKFLVLTVKDDGKGFADTDLMQATTLFYSKDKGNEHFGIGLTVCKLLCEKQGGLLCISNNETSGACVVAELEVF